MAETFEKAVARLVQHHIQEMYTAIPAVVVTVNNTETLSVDVQPLINNLYRDGSNTQRPILQDIPLVMPATQTSMVRLPVSSGDIVLLVFCMRSLDTFKVGDGSPQPPPDFRKFNKRDAVAIPGLFPFQINPNSNRQLDNSSTDLSLTHNIGKPTEVTLRLTEQGEVKITSPGKVSVDCLEAEITSATDITLSAVNVNVEGLFSINGNPYDLHTHSGVTSGSDPSGPVVPIP